MTKTIEDVPAQIRISTPMPLAGHDEKSLTGFTLS